VYVSNQWFPDLLNEYIKLSFLLNPGSQSFSDNGSFYFLLILYSKQYSPKPMMAQAIKLSGLLLQIGPICWIAQEAAI
jgi:hypothetical protein